MNAPEVAPEHWDIRPGANVVFLLDRAVVLEVDLDELGEPELNRRATEWLCDGNSQFFMVIAKNYQPVPETDSCTFSGYTDSMLVDDPKLLLSTIRQVILEMHGHEWLMRAEASVMRSINEMLVGPTN